MFLTRNKNTGMSQRKVEESGGRNSNLELYRIVVMLLIIAHHYVVNSGLSEQMYSFPKSGSAVFLYLFGAWGKTGINCFVLISGYFMCESKITLKKFVKLVLELKFYQILFSCIFWATDYEEFTVGGLRRLLCITTSVKSNFPGCYTVFFLLIPFLNILVHHLTEKMHLLLMLLCLGVYSGLGSMSWGSVTINYISWFSVLYLVASYIRLYPKSMFQNVRFWGVAAMLSWGISVVSILARIELVTTAKVYFYLSDSNKILAFTNGLTSFLFFKNLNIKNSKLINALGATTYGVLLIHANSDSMRKWLWKDILRNTEQFGSPKLVVHAIGSVLAIFIICSVIDWVRIRFLEKPFFTLWDKHYDRFLVWYREKEEKVLKRLSIEE